MNTKQLNTINNTMAAEIKAAEAEAKRAADEDAIATAQPKTILNMIQDIYDGKLLIITDDNDNIIGINCPTSVKGINNTQKVGPHMVMGENEANMHEDEIELRKFMKSYEGQNVQHMFYAALLIKNANLHPEYAELINGSYYFVVNDLKKAIDENGNTIVDISGDVTCDIDSNLLTNILIDKLHLTVPEEHYEDYNEIYDEGSDYDDDSEDYNEISSGYRNYDHNDDYRDGYADGWEDGYTDGIEDDYECSFTENEEASEAYREGYRDGYEEGFEEGLDA